MPPPKRPKAGLSWMNKLLSDIGSTEKIPLVISPTGVSSPSVSLTTPSVSLTTPPTAPSTATSSLMTTPISTLKSDPAYFTASPPMLGKISVNEDIYNSECIQKTEHGETDSEYLPCETETLDADLKESAVREISHSKDFESSDSMCSSDSLKENTEPEKQKSQSVEPGEMKGEKNMESERHKDLLVLPNQPMLISMLMDENSPDYVLETRGVSESESCHGMSSFGNGQKELVTSPILQSLMTSNGKPGDLTTHHMSLGEIRVSRQSPQHSKLQQEHSLVDSKPMCSRPELNHSSMPVHTRKPAEERVRNDQLSFEPKLQGLSNGVQFGERSSPVRFNECKNEAEQYSCENISVSKGSSRGHIRDDQFSSDSMPPLLPFRYDTHVNRSFNSFQGPNNRKVGEFKQISTSADFNSVTQDTPLDLAVDKNNINENDMKLDCAHNRDMLCLTSGQTSNNHNYIGQKVTHFRNVQEKESTSNLHSVTEPRWSDLQYPTKLSNGTLEKSVSTANQSSNIRKPGGLSSDIMQAIFNNTGPKNKSNTTTGLVNTFQSHHSSQGNQFPNRHMTKDNHALSNMLSPDPDKPMSLSQCINSIVLSTLLNDQDNENQLGDENIIYHYEDNVKHQSIHDGSETKVPPREHKSNHTVHSHAMIDCRVSPPGDNRQRYHSMLPSRKCLPETSSSTVLAPGEYRHKQSLGSVLPTGDDIKKTTPYSVLPPGECIQKRRHSPVLPPSGLLIHDIHGCSSPDESERHPRFPSQRSAHMDLDAFSHCNQPGSNHGSDTGQSSPTVLLSPRNSTGTLSPSRDGNSSDGSSPTMQIPSNNSDLDRRVSSDSNDDGKNNLISRQCQVCNDAASGFHYGVWSCEGCKAFFKRSLQGPINYVCPATNSCTIDKHRRKSCQACRLRKCIEMGMSRGNCREKKGPHLQLKRKSEDSENTDNAKQPMISPPLYHELTPTVKREPQVCSVRPLVDPDLHPTQPTHNAVPPPTEANPIHLLVDHLLKIEPRPHYSDHDPSSPSKQTAENMLVNILKVADRELMDIVAWARAIPGYMELTLKDRMQLLEMSWMEILVLGLVWRSVPHQDQLVFAPNWHVHREELELLDSSNLHKKVLTLVKSLQQEHVTHEEIVLLRTCVLLNAGVHNLSNEKYFEELQKQVHTALHYTVVQRGKQSISRMTRLLLLLPQLRQVSIEAITILSNLKQQDKLPSSVGLIGEVLVNQNIVSNLSYGQANLT